MGAVVDFVEDVFDEVEDFFEDVFETVVDVVEDAVDWVEETVEDSIDWIGERVEDVGDSLDDLGHLLDDVANSVLDEVLEVIDDVGGPIGEEIRDQIQFTRDLVEDLGKGHFSKAGRDFEDHIRETLKGLEDFKEDAIDDLIGVIAELDEELAETLRSSIDNFSDVFEHLAEGDFGDALKAADDFRNDLVDATIMAATVLSPQFRHEFLAAKDALFNTFEALAEGDFEGAFESLGDLVDEVFAEIVLVTVSVLFPPAAPVMMEIYIQYKQISAQNGGISNFVDALEDGELAAIGQALSLAAPIPGFADIPGMDTLIFAVENAQRVDQGIDAIENGDPLAGVASILSVVQEIPNFETFEQVSNFVDLADQALEVAVEIDRKIQLIEEIGRGDIASIIQGFDEFLGIDQLQDLGINELIDEEFATDILGEEFYTSIKETFGPAENPDDQTLGSVIGSFFNLDDTQSGTDVTQRKLIDLYRDIDARVKVVEAVSDGRFKDAVKGFEKISGVKSKDLQKLALEGFEGLLPDDAFRAEFEQYFSGLNIELELFEEVLDGLGDVLQNAWDAAGGVVEEFERILDSELLDDFGDFLEDSGNAIADGLGDIVEDIGDLASHISGELGDELEQVLDEVNELLGVAKDTVDELFLDDLNEALDKLLSICEDLEAHSNPETVIRNPETLRFDVSTMNVSSLDQLGMQQVGQQTVLTTSDGRMMVLDALPEALPELALKGLYEPKESLQVFHAARQTGEILVEGLNLNEPRMAIDISEFHEVKRFSDLGFEQDGADAIVRLGGSGAFLRVSGVTTQELVANSHKLIAYAQNQPGNDILFGSYENFFNDIDPTREYLNVLELGPDEETSSESRATLREISVQYAPARNAQESSPQELILNQPRNSFEYLLKEYAALEKHVDGQKPAEWVTKASEEGVSFLLNRGKVESIFLALNKLGVSAGFKAFDSIFTYHQEYHRALGFFLNEEIPFSQSEIEAVAKHMATVHTFLKVTSSVSIAAGAAVAGKVAGTALGAFLGSLTANPVLAVGGAVAGRTIGTFGLPIVAVWGSNKHYDFLVRDNLDVRMINGLMGTNLEELDDVFGYDWSTVNGTIEIFTPPSDFEVFANSLANNAYGYFDGQLYQRVDNALYKIDNPDLDAQLNHIFYDPEADNPNVLDGLAQEAGVGNFFYYNGQLYKATEDGFVIGYASDNDADIDESLRHDPEADNPIVFYDHNGNLVRLDQPTTVGGIIKNNFTQLKARILNLIEQYEDQLSVDRLVEGVIKEAEERLEALEDEFIAKKEEAINDIEDYISDPLQWLDEDSAKDLLDSLEAKYLDLRNDIESIRVEDFYEPTLAEMKDDLDELLGKVKDELQNSLDQVKDQLVDHLGIEQKLEAWKNQIEQGLKALEDQLRNTVLSKLESGFLAVEQMFGDLLAIENFMSEDFFNQLELIKQTIEPLSLIVDQGEELLSFTYLQRFEEFNASIKTIEETIFERNLEVLVDHIQKRVVEVDSVINPSYVRHIVEVQTREAMEAVEGYFDEFKMQDVIQQVSDWFFSGAPFYGTDGDDSITGSDDDDYVITGLGRDTIDVGAGDDYIEATSDSQTILGGAGDDFILSAPVDGDQSSGANSGDSVEGGSGNDEIYGSQFDDTLKGGDDDDFIAGEYDFTAPSGTYGQDEIYGGAGNDTLLGGGQDDSLYGGEGDDLLQADAGDDSLEGGAGEDSLIGISGQNTLRGGADSDRLFGGDDQDSLYGGGAGDFLSGDMSNTLPSGAADEIYGEAGDDTLVGGQGDDTLDGGADADWLQGDAGDDSLIGGAGNDSLRGNEGENTYVGGAGEDLFVIDADDQATIEDFDVFSAREVIDIRAWNQASFINLNMLQDGSDVVVSTAQGHSLRLKNLQVADLHEGHFQGFNRHLSHWQFLASGGIEQFLVINLDGQDKTNIVADVGALGLQAYDVVLQSWSVIVPGDAQQFWLDDFDGDQLEDFVIDYGSLGLHYHQQGSEAVELLTLTDVLDAVIIDFDQDGDLDILVNTGANEMLGLFDAQGQPVTGNPGLYLMDFASRSWSALVGTLSDADFAGEYLLEQMEVVDFDGDGFLDIVGDFGELGFAIYDQQTGFWTNVDAFLGRDATQFEVIDFNADGHLNIVSNYADQGLHSFYPNAQPLPVLRRIEENPSEQFQVVDFDNDGLMDIFSDFGSLGFWMYDQGLDLWKPIVTDDVEQFLVTDFDGDGHEDILIDVGQAGLWLYERDSGLFNIPENWQQLTFDDVQQFEVIDLNGDGFLDVVANMGDAGFHVYQQGNATPFAPDLVFTINEEQTGIFDVTEFVFDPDFDSIFIEAVELSIEAEHGSVSVVSDLIFYRPDENFFGQDRFDYTVVDEDGAVSTGTITIDVTGTYDPIGLRPQNASEIFWAVGQHFDSLELNAFDNPDQRPLNYELLSKDGRPVPGWISFDSSTGILSGTPSASDADYLQLVLRASDGLGSSAEFDFSLQVQKTSSISENADTIVGNQSDNHLDGRAGNDLIIGAPGADTLIGGTGDDSLYGGDGQDTATYEGNFEDYELVLENDQVRVRDLNAADGDEGEDLLESIEQIEFADRIVGFDEFLQLSDVSMQVARGKSVQKFIADPQNYQVSIEHAPEYGLLSIAPDGSLVFEYPELQENDNQNVPVFLPDSFTLRIEDLASGLISFQKFEVQPHRPDGPIVQIEDFPTSDYLDSAELSDGGIVLVWHTGVSHDESGMPDGSSRGVFAQVFDADGNARSGTFQVNDYVNNMQHFPAVEALDDGRFVLTWTSRGQDGHGDGIFAKIYDSRGQELTEEFQVNQTIDGGQRYPDVEQLSDGRFVIVWHGENDLYGQIYSAEGEALGDNFRAHAPGSPSEKSSLTALDNGNFVLAYEAHGQDYIDIFVQVFNPQGGRMGGPSPVNTFVNEEQRQPQVVALQGSDFVVTWMSHAPQTTSAGREVRARVLNSSGGQVSSEIAVNSTRDHDQRDPAVAMLNDGSFVIVWTDLSDQNSPDNVIMGKIFFANGNVKKEEFLISPANDDSQLTPSITSTGDGGFVVSWFSYWQNRPPGGHFPGILSQKFDASGSKQGDIFQAVTDDFFSVPGLETFEGTAGDDVLQGTDGDNTLLGYHGADVLDGLEGVDTVSYKDSDEAVFVNLASGEGQGGHAQGDQLHNIEGVIGSDFDDTFVGGLGDNLFDGGAGVDRYVLEEAQGYDIVLDDGQIIVRDLNLEDGDNGIDTLINVEEIELGGQVFTVEDFPEGEDGVLIIDKNRTVEGVLSPGLNLQYEIIKPSLHGNVLFHAGGTYSYEPDPEFVGKDSFEYKVTNDRGLSRVITQNVQVYDSLKHSELRGKFALGSEFLVNTQTEDSQFSPDTALINDDFYVVTWASRYRSSAGFSVLAQVFDTDHNPIGSEFEVRSYNYNSASFGPEEPSVLTLSEDRLLILWEGLHSLNKGNQVLGRILGVNDGHLFAETDSFFMNSPYDGPETAVQSIVLNDNRFIVVWASDFGEAGIHGQMFDLQGEPVGGTFIVHDQGGHRPNIMRLSGNRFVVLWDSLDSNNRSQGILGQILDSSAQKVGDTFVISSEPTGQSKYSSTEIADLVLLSEDLFAVTWTAKDSDSGLNDIYAQVFDSSGQKVGSQISVNQNDSASHFEARITATDNGGFFITWYSKLGNAYQILLRFYPAYDQDPLEQIVLVDNLQNSSAEPMITQISQTEYTVSWNHDGDIYTKSFTIFDEFLGHGHDVLYGTDLNDTIEASDGADVFYGSDGEDLVSYLNSPEGVWVDLNEGQGFHGYALGDQFFSIEQIVGSNDNDTFVGGQGDNFFDGAAGTDTFVLSDLVEYEIVYDQGLIVVRDLTESGGVDLLLNVEQIQIGTQLYKLDDFPEDFGGIVRFTSSDHEIKGYLADPQLYSFKLDEDSVSGQVTVHDDGIFTYHPGDSQSDQFSYLLTNIHGLSRKVTVQLERKPIVESQFAFEDFVFGLGSEFILSDSFSAQTHPQSQLLDDGNILVAWATNEPRIGFGLGPPPEPIWKIQMQIYDQNGFQEITEEIHLGRSDFNDLSVAKLTDGGFVVSWKELTDSGKIHVRHYDRNYDFVKESILEDGQSFSNFTLNNGHYLVSWEHGDQLFGQIFDGDGSQTIMLVDNVYSGVRAFAQTIEDGFLMSWISQEDGHVRLYAQFYTSEGTPLEAPFQINVQDLLSDSSNLSVDQQFNPQIMALSEDQFIVVWENYQQGLGQWDLKARTILANGQILSDEMTLAEGIVPEYGQTSMIDLGNQNFAVLFKSSDGSLKLEGFNLEGLSLGKISLIDQLNDDYADATPTVTALNNGQAMIVWSQDGDIQAKILSLDEDYVVGTERNDALYGGLGDDTLVGLEGADVLDGFDGMDTASYQSSNQAVMIDLQEGLVQGGHAQGDQLRNIEAVIGSAFDDQFRGDHNDNQFDGGEGFDQVTYNKALSEYDVAFDGQSVTVFDRSGADGFDTFTNVEQLVFSDQTVTLEDFPTHVSGEQQAVQGQSLTGKLGDGRLYDFELKTQAEHGTVEIFEDGRYVYTPNPDYTGSDQFQYMAINADGLSREFQAQLDIQPPVLNLAVPEYLVGSGGGAESERSVITALTEGRYIVMWHQRSSAPSSWDLKAQIYNSDGTAVAGEFDVNVAVDGDIRFSDIVALPDGGFFVTWRLSFIEPGLSTNYQIYGKFFDHQGEALAEEFIVPSTFDYAALGSSAAVLGDEGQFVHVLWSYRGDSAESMRMQKYNFHGQPEGAEQILFVESPGIRLSNPQVSAVSKESGYRLLVYKRYDTQAEEAKRNQFQVRVLNEQGELQGTAINVGENYDYLEKVSVAEMDNGYFVLVGSGGNNISFAQIFDAYGVPLGSELVLTDSFDYEYLDVAALPDGYFIVSWYDTGIKNIFAQIFDVQGHAIGDVFQVNDVHDFASHPDVEYIDGKIIFTWINLSSIRTILTKTFQLESLLLSGTDGNDALQGDLADDTFRGSEGADVYDGLAGEDLVDYSTSQAVNVDLLAGSGQGGFAEGDLYLNIDHVHGSRHADTLKGNDGDNHLRGSQGNDVFLVSAGADTLDGGSGVDRLVFSSDEHELFKDGQELWLVDLVSQSRSVIVDIEEFEIDGNLYTQQGFSEVQAGRAYIVAGGVLRHGYLGDPAQFNFELLDGPKYGQVSFTGSRYFYEASQGFLGSDQFSYLVRNGQGLAQVETVDIEVYEDIASEDLLPISEDLSAGSRLSINPPSGEDFVFPQVAPLAQGNYVVVWNEQQGVNGENYVWAQAYNAQDQPIGTAIELNSEGYSYYARAASINEDHVAVVFYTWFTEQANSQIMTQVLELTENGLQVNQDPFMANTQTDPFQRHPDVAALGDGQHFVVVWATSDPEEWVQNRNARDYQIDAQVFNAQGQKVGLELQIAQVEGYSLVRPSVVALDEQRFLVLWDLILESSDRSEGIQGQVFDISGQDLSPIFTVSDVPSGMDTRTQNWVVSNAQVLPNGQMLIAWSEQVAHKTAYTYVQAFDSSGIPQGLKILVDEQSSLRSARPDIVVTDDGGFIVTWNREYETSPGNTTYRILFRAYDDQFEPLTDALEVEDFWPPEREGTQLGPVIAHVGGNKYILANASQGFNIEVQNLLLAVDLQAAGGHDLIQGGSSDDLILGLGGNDVLDGGGGENTLQGGQGDDYLVSSSSEGDVLLGGTGDDTIHTALGNSSVDGGDDQDTIMIDQGGNTISGGEGHDTFVVYRSPGSGVSEILDFEFDNPQERIDLHQFESSMVSFLGLREAMSYDAQLNITTIDLGEGQSLVVHGGDLRTLSNGRFVGNFLEHVITGTELGERIDGTELDDEIRGLAGDDTLTGAMGNDTLKGGDNNDLLRGEQDHDLLQGGKGADSLYGGSGDDHLQGGDNDDTLQGNTGSDTIDGGEGSDLLSYWSSEEGVYVNMQSGQADFGDATGDQFESIERVSGSQFDDTLIGSASEDTLIGYDGNDSLEGGALGDSLSGGSGDDTLKGQAGDDILNASIGDDLVLGGSGNDTIFAATGQDTYDGGADFDLVSFVHRGGRITLDLKQGTSFIGIEQEVLINIEHVIGTEYNDTLTGSDFVDTLEGHLGDDSIMGAMGSDVLKGNQGQDRLYGEQGDDALFGGDDSDLLEGGDGADTLDGGAQDDQLFGGQNNDWLIGGLGADFLDGGFGLDKVSYENADATVSLDMQLAQGLSGEALGDVYVSIEEVWASAYDDTLLGADFVDIFHGAAGDDRIFGRAGNDQLDGGAGADHIDGGLDIDRVIFKESQQAVHVDLGLGAGFQGDALGDTYENVENVLGSAFGDHILGDALSNLLDGAAGDDQLEGQAGDDTLLGGLGADSLYGFADNDVLEGGDGQDSLSGGDDNDTLIGGAGADTLDGGSGADMASYEGVGAGENILVDLALNIGQGGYAEGDQYIGIEHVLGSSYNDSLKGDELANRLDGALGDDVLEGRGGDDTLLGGLGDDSLEGGQDNDSLVGGDGQDVLEGGDHQDTLEGGDGHDRLFGELGEDVLYGGKGADQLFGGDERDELYGGAGRDTLSGGEGADLLDGGDGEDTVSYILSLEAVFIDLQTGEFSGGHAEGDQLVSIERIVGSLHNDSLVGDEGDNWLVGHVGDDTLRGGAGNDQLEGHEGRNVLDGGADVDLVSYHNSFERLVVDLQEGILEGGYADDDVLIDIEQIAGTVYDDSLSGDDLANTFIGLDGDDELYGRAGNDSLYGYDGDDLLEGGDDQDALYGSTGDDTLRGGQGQDFLQGGAGADTLDGGEDLDVAVYWNSYEAILIDLAADLFEGGDATGDILIDIEQIQGSYYDDALKGDQHDNQFFGSLGNDQIEGRAGNDLLDGGQGDDILFGGENSDSLLGSEGDDALFGSSGNDYLRGDEGADQLAGGTGIDGLSYWTSGQAVSVNLETGEAQGGDAQGDSFTSIERLFGSAHDDTLVGDQGENSLVGGDGYDSIEGGAGNDYIEGGDGQDSIDGGDGIDTVSYWNSDKALRVDLSRNLFNGGDANGDYVRNVEHVFASAFDDTLRGAGADDYFRGLAGADLIEGFAGDDRLHGGSGEDTLRGGVGSDTLRGGHGGDLFVIQADETSVDVIEDFDYEDLLEKIDLSAFASELNNSHLAYDAELNRTVITLDSGQQLILENVKADLLSAENFVGIDWFVDLPEIVDEDFEGPAVYVDIEDSLISGEDYAAADGSDFVGSQQNDSIEGQAGDDLISGGTGDDILSGGGGFDLLLGGEGDDRLVFTADSHFEAEAREFTSYHGSPGNPLSGGFLLLDDYVGSFDVFDGGEGFDELMLSDANDVIFLENSDILDENGQPIAALSGIEAIYAGLGNDLVNLTSLKFSYGDVQVDGGQGDDIIWDNEGNGLLIGGAGEDWIDGNRGDDDLQGGDGEDRLLGRHGNDTLTGGADADLLVGFEGNDLFVYEQFSDSTVLHSDRIFLFEQGSDVIDLSALGIQRMDELQTFTENNITYIQIEAHAFEIELMGTYQLVATDFDFVL